MKKLVKVDEKIFAAFAGLTADARVLINQARVECQSYRLTCDEAPSVEYVARWVAQLQQKYTQAGGVRPFGVTSLIAGFDDAGKPALFQTDPSGICSSWKAAAAGKNEKFVREFLEKNFTADQTRAQAIKLCVRALLEVTDSGEGALEVVVLTADGKPEALPDAEIVRLCKEIDAEKEAEAKAKAARKGE